jgi:hypothetical protein
MISMTQARSRAGAGGANGKTCRQTLAMGFAVLSSIHLWISETPN